MATKTLEVITSKSKMTEKQVKAHAYRSFEPAFIKGTIVCIPPQYAVDKDITIKEKGVEKTITTKAFYAYILDLEGNLVDTKYVTYPSLIKEALCEGKLQETITVKTSEDGRHWSTLQSKASNIVGIKPEFELDAEEFLYLAKSFSCKVEDNKLFAFADLVKNSQDKYEHAHKGEYLVPVYKSLPILVSIQCKPEFSVLPNDEIFNEVKI